MPFLHDRGIWPSRQGLQCIHRFGPQDPLPETERRLAEILTLPLHPHLERVDVEAVVRVLRSLLP